VPSAGRLSGYLIGNGEGGIVFMWRTFFDAKPAFAVGTNPTDFRDPHAPDPLATLTTKPFRDLG